MVKPPTIWAGERKPVHWFERHVEVGVKEGEAEESEGEEAPTTSVSESSIRMSIVCMVHTNVILVCLVCLGVCGVWCGVPAGVGVIGVGALVVALTRITRIATQEGGCARGV